MRLTIILSAIAPLYLGMSARPALLLAQAPHTSCTAQHISSGLKEYRLLSIRSSTHLPGPAGKSAPPGRKWVISEWCIANPGNSQVRIRDPWMGWQGGSSRGVRMHEGGDAIVIGKKSARDVTWYFQVPKSVTEVDIAFGTSSTTWTFFVRCP